MYITSAWETGTGFSYGQERQYTSLRSAMRDGAQRARETVGQGYAVVVDRYDPQPDAILGDYIITRLARWRAGKRIQPY